MNKSHHPIMKFYLSLFFAIVAILTGGASTVFSQDQCTDPLMRTDFKKAAAQGFGEKSNTKAWSMYWWQDHLFVGTAREHMCVQAASLAFRLGPPWKYPPPEQNPLGCTDDPEDLPMRAEIWSIAPQETNAHWKRVYRSPENVYPKNHPGKVIARDIGYRSMIPFVDPEDQTERLYMDGVTSLSFNPGVPPPRLLRTEDGINFEAVPQDPGTVLGDLGFRHGSMRGMEVYKDRLFVLIGETRGFGELYEATQPGGGNNYFQAVTPGMKIYELCSYNGSLYIGLTQSESLEGYSVLKTDATGEPPYQFETIVDQGAYLTPIPSDTVVSMYVYDGRLYIGTDKPAEIIRINPDDSWDLIVGAPRTTPDGVEKLPLSGMHAGFNYLLNEHMWRMNEYKGWLYVGTNDMTVLIKNWPIMNLPIIGGILRRNMGYDFAASPNGVDYTIINRRGFGDPDEIGIRTFASTPYGMYFGTSNYYAGLRIWRGQYDTTSSAPAAPRRLEAETGDGQVLLAWDPVDGATNYRIYRAEGYGPLIDYSTYTEIGTTPETTFVDKAAKVTEGSKQALMDLLKEMSTSLEDWLEDPGSMLAAGLDKVPCYTYYVMAEDSNGTLSKPSNLAPAPSLAPVATLSLLNNQVNRLLERGHFTSSEAAEWVIEQLASIEESLSRNTVTDVAGITNSLFESIENNQRSSSGKLMDQWCAEDLAIMTDKFVKRAKWAQQGLLSADELR